MYFSFERILLTLWIGSMWTVGYLVAPVLFSQLDDRAMAGNLAGEMFTLVSYIGLVSGLILLVGQWRRHGRPSRQHWLSGIMLIMLLVVGIGEFVLLPQMVILKDAGLEGENLAQFFRLHGIASILFLINSLLGLVLIARWHRA